MHASRDESGRDLLALRDGGAPACFARARLDVAAYATRYARGVTDQAGDRGFRIPDALRLLAVVLRFRSLPERQCQRSSCGACAVSVWR